MDDEAAETRHTIAAAVSSFAADDASRAVPVLVISGAIGIGKTTVAYEARIQLRDAGISHVFIDDEFALFNPRPNDDAETKRLTGRALAALWGVYREAGIRRLMLASVVETDADLNRLGDAVPGAEIQLFQLVAPLRAADGLRRIRRPKRRPRKAQPVIRDESTHNT